MGIFPHSLRGKTDSAELSSLYNARGVGKELADSTKMMLTQENAFILNPNIGLMMVEKDGTPQLANVAVSYKGGFITAISKSHKDATLFLSDLIRLMKSQVIRKEEYQKTSWEEFIAKKILLTEQEVSAYAHYNPTTETPILRQASTLSTELQQSLVVNPEHFWSNYGEIPKSVFSVSDDWNFINFFSSKSPDSCGKLLWVRSPWTRVWWPYSLTVEEEQLFAKIASGVIRVNDMDQAIVENFFSAEILISKPKWGEREQKILRLRKDLAAQRFLHIPALVNRLQVDRVRCFFDSMYENGYLKMGDRDSNRRAWTHNDCLSRYIQIQLAPFISEIAGTEYVPFFTKLAVYVDGSRLLPHKDKVQDAYVLSIPISYTVNGVQTEDQWPLRFVNQNDPQIETPVLGGLGGGIIFDGYSLTHYRGYIQPNHRTQVMLLSFVKPTFGC